MSILANHSSMHEVVFWVIEFAFWVSHSALCGIGCLVFVILLPHFSLYVSLKEGAAGEQRGLWENRK